MQIYSGLDEHRYTLNDIATLARVPAKSVRNWLARGTLVIGRRHWLGRYEFTMLDVVRVSLVGVLTGTLAISLEDAAKVAEAVIPCVRGRAWPGDWLLLARSPDDGTWLAGWQDDLASNPPGLRTMPHARIPVSALINDLHRRVGISPLLQPGLSDGDVGSSGSERDLEAGQQRRLDE